MLRCISSAKKRTYIGFTSNLKKRLKDHNSNKGAKYTRGNRWIIIYKKSFSSKSEAMSYEYSLKHDKKERLRIYNYNK
tara:strand:- start:673 stop:906 length:234 start_codon:yes stop_codon:yes gene_type:complete